MKKSAPFKYPGTSVALDGGAAVVMCERHACDATASSRALPNHRMAELWAREVAAGTLNMSGRPLLQVAVPGDSAALSAVVGLALTGLRTTGFFDGTGLLAAHEALLGAAGKHIATVLNVADSTAGRSALSGLAGHDGFNAASDSGFFQLFAKNAQEAADLALIAHRIAEMALVPGVVARDGAAAVGGIESLLLPGRELIAEYLGRPDDVIESPTPAQRLLFGLQRRRIPELWSVDTPAMTGAAQRDDAYAPGLAAQRPYYLGHVVELTESAMEEYFQLTGRRYERVSTYRAEDAEYLIIAQGEVVATAEAVADHMRKTRKTKVGVVNLTMSRPFPGDRLGHLLHKRAGVVVLERYDQPLAEDAPIAGAMRAVLHKCLENGAAKRGAPPHPAYASYTRMEQAPPLYSACYGMGGREPEPEALIGAVEQMLPQGANRRTIYLSLDFYRDAHASPKQEVYQQTLADAYPAIRTLAVRGSENPSLLPTDAVVVRIHGTAGRELFTLDDHLAHTLAELRGFYVKTFPEPAAPARGQPSVNHMAFATEPIRVSSAPRAVDVVIAADPLVFNHSDPLEGLKAGGALILQTDIAEPAAVWAAIPPRFQRVIAENRLEVQFIDAMKIAREEARLPEQQYRVVGRVLQGCCLATPAVAEATRLVGRELMRELKRMLAARAETGGTEDAEGELNLLRRGVEGLIKLAPLPPAEIAPQPQSPEMPTVLKHLPVHAVPAMDIHRFWEETGASYAAGNNAAILAEPFLGSGLIPAATGLLRDLSATRAEYPEWIPEKCTGCGACWTVCPDSALPGLVNGIGEVLQTTLQSMERRGYPTKHLPRAVRSLEGQLRELLAKGPIPGAVIPHLSQAITQTIAASRLPDDGMKELEQEFSDFRAELSDFPLAVTRPFFTEMEAVSRGGGGLVSVTLDPSKCKACKSCVKACPEDALVVKPQTPGGLAVLRRNWNFWLKLPTTDRKYLGRPGSDGAPGLEALLLDKKAYLTMVGGDHADPGAAEKTITHLFTATVDAVMQPRVAAHVARVDELIGRLERHIRLNLAVGVEDVDAVRRAMAALRDREYTLAELSAKLDRERHPVDAEWLERVTRLLSGLKDLKGLYTHGPTHQGRSNLGMVAASDPIAAWGSTYPYNPFPFPWSSHMCRESPALAAGIFEGHMAKMAEGFKLIRLTDLELDGKYNREIHDPYFARFTWRHFSEEEFLLCPPLLLVGGDEALSGSGLHDLAGLLRSGRPIKLLCLDTQAYSHLAGLAGQPGLEPPGERPARVEGAMRSGPMRGDITLLAIAHRGTYVMQGSLANIPALLKAFMVGLSTRRPALFSAFCSSLPRDGSADDLAVHQSRLALESRAHPSLSFDPDRGDAPDKCIDLEGNPAPDEAWVTRSLAYLDENGESQSMDVAVTYADFAVTVPALQHHFRVVPREEWRDTMVPVPEFLALDAQEREESEPFIWATDYERRLQRLRVSRAMVDACEERRQYWRLLRALTREDIVPVDEGAIAERARAEVVEKVWQNLLELAQSGEALPAVLTELAGPAQAGGESEDGIAKT
jgi:pyruvate-ferredoxin/flavodoxin oxidoreductase